MWFPFTPCSCVVPSLLHRFQRAHGDHGCVILEEKKLQQKMASFIFMALPWCTYGSRWTFLPKVAVCYLGSSFESANQHSKASITYIYISVPTPTSTTSRETTVIQFTRVACIFEYAMLCCMFLFTWSRSLLPGLFLGVLPTTLICRRYIS